MEKWVMVIWGTATRMLPGRPVFLQAFDVDAHDGQGSAAVVEDPMAAMKFDTQSDVLAAWQRESTVKPVRDDGRPNKPLSAYTIEPRLMVFPDEKKTT